MIDCYFMYSEKKSHQGSVVSGILLVTGTAIGAGMLAIPLVTGASGFLPAIAVNCFAWAFMLATGLLFLEATLWMPDGANVFTMAGRFLGLPGTLLGTFFFLFLYYCLMVSYIAGGAPLLGDALNTTFSLTIDYKSAIALFSLLFGLIVLVGAWFLDRVNWILMAGLFISYFFLVGMGAGEVNPELLLHKNWTLSLFALPVLFSAYGYHNVIPSISTYLKRSRSKLKLSIFIGTTIAFLIYSCWQWLIIGSVPLDTLKVAADAGVPANQLLYQITGNSWVGVVALFFGFYAIVTSLLGVSLSMVDFLGDAFQIKKRTGWRRLLLTLFVFVPPSLLAESNPGLFVEALGVAGGIGEAFLNGLLPVALVWVGRYHLKLEGKPLLPGGKLMLFILLLCSLFIMGYECWHLASV